jgi:hypothetical protein
VTKSGRLRWVGGIRHIYGGEEKCMGNPEGKQALGNPRQRWEDNIKNAS